MGRMSAQGAGFAIAAVPALFAFFILAAIGIVVLLVVIVALPFILLWRFASRRSRLQAVESLPTLPPALPVGFRLPCGHGLAIGDTECRHCRDKSEGFLNRIPKVEPSVVRERLRELTARRGR
jgi:hypothetical protein